MNQKCLDPECDYEGPVESYIHNKYPIPGNTGCWCPKCAYSVIITKDGEIDHFIDDETMELGRQLFGNAKMPYSELN